MRQYKDFIAFEICQGTASLIKTFANDFATAEEAIEYCRQINTTITNPKRCYAWTPKANAPEMRV